MGFRVRVSRARLLAAISGVALAAMLLGGAKAGAAIQLGEKFTEPGDAGFAGTMMQRITWPEPDNNRYVNVTGTQGVITRWSTFGSATPRTVKLKVGTTSDSGSPAVSMSRESALQSVAGETTHEFSVRIPIHPLATIGLYSPDAGAGLLRSMEDPNNVVFTKAGDILAEAGFSSGWTKEPGGARINVAATMEPDADLDGWGDETQDKCPGKKGDSEGCPPPTAAKPKSKTKATSLKDRIREARERGHGRRKPPGRTEAPPACKKGFKKTKVKVRRKGKVVKGKNGKPKTKTVCKKIKKKGKGKGKGAKKK